MGRMLVQRRLLYGQPSGQTEIGGTGGSIQPVRCAWPFDSRLHGPDGNTAFTEETYVLVYWYTTGAFLASVMGNVNTGMELGACTFLTLRHYLGLFGSYTNIIVRV